MYERLYKRVTESGVTLDKCIQPAVDFNGKIIGLVAGDEQCYEASCYLFLHILNLLPITINYRSQIFRDLFDVIIEDVHGVKLKPNETQPSSDLSPNKVRN